MSPSPFPLIVEPQELAGRLDTPGLLIVDLCKPDHYAQSHLPGAIHLDYSRIVDGRKPVPGRLPPVERLSEVFSALGLAADRHVIAYDDEGGGRAARLLWTLEVVGHPHYSLLDGGRGAWLAGCFPVDTAQATPSLTPFNASLDAGRVAVDREYILSHLHDEDVILVDARTPEEYNGQKALAARAGHIPGAVNYNWVNAMDRGRDLRLRPGAELETELEALGITQDKEVIVYCQTHHRSAYVYVVLKHLGYPRVRGYPGSWSEWGNREDTPVA